jgi:hypothetical protein
MGLHEVFDAHCGHGRVHGHTEGQGEETLQAKYCKHGRHVLGRRHPRQCDLGSSPYNAHSMFANPETPGRSSAAQDARHIGLQQLPPDLAAHYGCP